MKIKKDHLTIEVRKRRKSDPHWRGYGEYYSAQIIWPCKHHMQSLGFNIPTEEEAVEIAESFAEDYPTCQEYGCNSK